MVSHLSLLQATFNSQHFKNSFPTSMFKSSLFIFECSMVLWYKTIPQCIVFHSFTDGHWTAYDFVSAVSNTVNSLPHKVSLDLPYTVQ